MSKEQVGQIVAVVVGVVVGFTWGRIYEWWWQRRLRAELRHKEGKR